MMAGHRISARFARLAGRLRKHRTAARTADPLIVHVHIPKTGGTSFNDFLFSSFGERHVPLYQADPRVVLDAAAMDRAVRRQPGAMVISSHSFRHFPDRIAGRDARYLTILRHPLERRLSYWRYARKHYDTLGDAHRAVLPDDFMEMSAEAWLAFEARLAEMGMTYGQVHYFSAAGDVAEAKRTLRRFLAVGVLEEMPASLEWIRSGLRGLGIQTPDLPAVHLNRTDEPTPEMEVPAYLADEMDLYQWARQRLLDHVPSA